MITSYFGRATIYKAVGLSVSLNATVNRHFSRRNSAQSISTQQDAIIVHGGVTPLGGLTSQFSVFHFGSNFWEPAICRSSPLPALELHVAQVVSLFDADYVLFLGAEEIGQPVSLWGVTLQGELSIKICLLLLSHQSCVVQY